MAITTFVLLCLLVLIPSAAGATDFPNVTYHRCYDGDTCTFTIPGVHPLFGEKISVRIAGIDAPEIKGKCQKEKALAKKARDIVRGMLKDAHRIDLLDAQRGKVFPHRGLDARRAIELTRIVGPTGEFWGQLIGPLFLYQIQPRFWSRVTWGDVTVPKVPRLSLAQRRATRLGCRS